ncbi:fluoroquinolone transport system permease protein [Lipingzhangella halophila]|uniref:Fluoroquinolone transport system permease protein n=1 Tax=Lipingzhangella halophila TaxID=1783352 RepID=A0A7W7RJF1_9ACTN|nr:ABC transporter permease [Lipingzhangella halophila]MBB4932693.1 fluoroquinolone transport system permease protein [Lipingzhangella halophila]
MASTALAFGRGDLINIRRDPMFRFLLLAPLVYAALTRFALPPLTSMLAEDFGFDLVPYHPLILTFFLVLGPTMIIAALGGLLLIEEKDAGTLAAVRVTPASLSAFATYRGLAFGGIILAYVVVTMFLSGYVEARMLPAVLAAGLCAAALGATIMILMALASANKLEGLAIVRALGLLVTALPILPWSVPPPWEYAFGVLPAYWPAKVYWVAAEGGAYWPHLLIGLLYNGALLYMLTRAFSRRPQ